MFVWMAKFGAAYGVRTGIHVGVDVLVNQLEPEPAQARWCCSACSAARCSPPWSAPWALKFVMELYATDQVSADLEAAALDRVLRVPARLLPDVLPLPAGRLGVLADRRAAAPRREPRRRRRVDAPACIRPIAPPRGRAMNSALIFGLLIALMLTGMPISIALGLTVLTFLFTMTQVPIEAVALKLFTGIENFEIMAIPFFILAGNFLTHGGVARRMIAFATSMIGHWYGGLGLAGVMACALFAAISGSSPATVVAIGSIILPAMVAQGFPEALRRRRDRDLGRARHPDSAVDRDGDLSRSRPAAASRSIPKASACSRPRSAQLFMAGVIPA